MQHAISHYMHATASGDILNEQHKSWQKTLDVDLTAVMVGTRLAVQCMQAKKNPGALCGVHMPCYFVVKEAWFSSALAPPAR